MAKISNPFIILTGGEGVKPYHIIQTDVGVNDCTIATRVRAERVN